MANGQWLIADGQQKTMVYDRKKDEKHDDDDDDNCHDDYLWLYESLHWFIAMSANLMLIWAKKQLLYGMIKCITFQYFQYKNAISNQDATVK